MPDQPEIPLCTVENCSDHAPLNNYTPEVESGKAEEFLAALRRERKEIGKETGKYHTESGLIAFTVSAISGTNHCIKHRLVEINYINQLHPVLEEMTTDNKRRENVIKKTMQRIKSLSSPRAKKIMANHNWILTQEIIERFKDCGLGALSSHGGPPGCDVFALQDSQGFISFDGNYL